MLGLLAYLVQKVCEGPSAGTLCDKGIWDELAYTEFDIYPLQPEQVQPASVDLRLGEDFQILQAEQKYGTSEDYQKIPIDTKESTDQPMKEATADSITIQPGECVLGTTMETVNLPADLLGEVEGRSSLGRLFIEVHKTAGVVDPGYRGEITLEIHNDNPAPVTLYKGQRVCQLLLTKLNRPAEEPYGDKEDSKYQGQEGATQSKLHQDE